jgi:hypothetical protein
VTINHLAADGRTLNGGEKEMGALCMGSVLSSYSSMISKSGEIGKAYAKLILFICIYLFIEVFAGDQTRGFAHAG